MRFAATLLILRVNSTALCLEFVEFSDRNELVKNFRLLISLKESSWLVSFDFDVHSTERLHFEYFFLRWKNHAIHVHSVQAANTNWIELSSCQAESSCYGTCVPRTDDSFPRQRWVAELSAATQLNRAELRTERESGGFLVLLLPVAATVNLGAFSQSPYTCKLSFGTELL